ncbi:MAG: hypothetical protein HC769_22750 [Cyanobacteria bacterium CRU_2_1]|nr:hypothetical protein [Cyanobacteria bacterium RU_5_0]NJR61403.1 hypothetical protein [Cyanobacteria bacterium CRU_2_1]
MNTTQHETLFTELTAEQAAIVEGGIYRRLGTIRGKRTETDFVGRNVFGTGDPTQDYEFYIAKRSKVDISLAIGFGFADNIRFNLYDDRDNDGYPGRRIDNGYSVRNPLKNGVLAAGVYRVKVHTPTSTLGGSVQFHLKFNVR